MKSSDDVLIYWDGGQDVSIKVPDSFKTGSDHDLAGMCGSYDDKPDNDFTDLSGTLHKSVADFGRSWLSDLTCLTKPNPPRGCYHPDNDVQKGLDRAEQVCTSIQGPGFAACHSFLPFQPYKEMCMSDVCACNYTARTDDCRCDALALYSRECALKYNITLSWRGPNLCRKYTVFTLTQRSQFCYTLVL